MPWRSRPAELSKGQKGQLGLALALAPRPELLVLDDPTLGLDVVARKELYEELVGELADRGTTVFLTTHDLAGVEAIADRVGVLVDGRLVSTRSWRLKSPLPPTPLRGGQLRADEAEALSVLGTLGVVRGAGASRPLYRASTTRCTGGCALPAGRRSRRSSGMSLEEIFRGGPRRRKGGAAMGGVLESRRGS